MTVIKVENIGKRYVIDHQKQQSHYRYETLGGTLANCGKSAFNFLRQPLSSLNNTVEHEDFWALKDINFEINQGDRVGIIGRNGAGKSTLLKILSRITAPTTGKITIKGRVSSLLEVGTGFHPELTGRENIYLNGAILGMKRQEIKAKFDEIVDFAEVEKFLDTPVKHYSSGMYVRLAFAVAAHLEPEILIVDEVLAVGDIQFQKKCLGQMETVAKKGRAIIFVSHNMQSIKNLCDSCIWISKGNIYEKGTAREIINKYFEFETQKNRNGLITEDMHSHQPKGICFTYLRILDYKGREANTTVFGQKLNINFKFIVNENNIPPIRIAVAIKSLEGHVVAVFHHTDDKLNEQNLIFNPGKYSIKLASSIPLMPGHYVIGLLAKPMPGFWGSEDYSLDFIESALTFSVEEDKDSSDELLPSSSNLSIKSSWFIEKE